MTLKPENMIGKNLSWTETKKFLTEKTQMSEEAVMSMEELFHKLSSVPNAYFGFVLGIIVYVKHKPERLKAVMDFLNSSDTLTTSDVIRFVSDQPDFFEDCADSRKEKQVRK